MADDSDQVGLLSDEEAHNQRDEVRRGLSRHRQSFFNRILRPCVGELVGVAIFVFIGTMSGMATDGLAMGAAHGLTIFIMVAALLDVSGGHLNPAVTLGVALGGAIPLVSALCYILAQLIGSILGAALTRGVLGIGEPTIYKTIGGGVPRLLSEATVGQGILCEATLTFLLVFTVLMTAVDRTNYLLAPPAIGLCVMVDIVAGGAITGAAMNPARAFGPAVVASNVIENAWSYHYIYWAGPAIGAVVAGLVYSKTVTAVFPDYASALETAAGSLKKRPIEFRYVQ